MSPDLSTLLATAPHASGRTQVRRASPDEAGVITDILAQGFMDDPISRWIFPDDVDRARLHPDFFSIFVTGVLHAGEIYVTEDYSGAALWLHSDPAVVEPPEEREQFRALFRSGLPEAAATRFLLLDTLMHDNHPGHAVHAYLPFIAVRPGSQRRGVGTALLTHTFTMLDAVRHPAYLEASSEHNRRLYRRLGFTPLGPTVAIPGGPAFYPMWRQPARTTTKQSASPHIPTQRQPENHSNG